MELELDLELERLGARGLWRVAREAAGGHRTNGALAGARLGVSQLELESSGGAALQNLPTSSCSVNSAVYSHSSLEHSKGSFGLIRGA